MIVIAVLLLAEFMGGISSQNMLEEIPCDEKYLRFSDEHTMCKVGNKKCKIYKRGVTEDDKKIILETHNKLRSKVATGNESEAGGMPKAANMLQMVWDEDLALEAQKHAEQCKYSHDCHDCRALEEYMVGQNIGEMRVTKFTKDDQRNWEIMINTFYDEFNYFDKKNIESFFPSEADPVTRYGYMTQVIWAKTWRVGCGWVLKKDKKLYNTSFFVCNYGPTGNIVGKKIYEVGKPCSKCPENTCCGKGCDEYSITSEYSGLCKIVDVKSAPQNAPGIDYIFFCSFNGESDCDRSSFGVVNWQQLNTVGGNWIRLVLKGGENASLIFEKSFKSANYGNLCFSIVLRTHNKAGEGPSTVLSSMYFVHDDEKTATFRMKPWNNGFTFSSYDFDLKLPRGDENKAVIEFSVPSELPPQIIDITQVSILRGLCTSHD